MSHIVNHPSFIAAAIARREELLAECERARLASSARSQSGHARPLAAVRACFGTALIRLGERIRPTTGVGTAEQPQVHGT
jgi:hypothetical protein